MKRIRFTGTMACSLIQAPFIRLDSVVGAGKEWDVQHGKQREGRR
ncbi:MAG TPA: hypothetical protein PLY15_16935 [Nitrospira sp.]|nr:hypothetical protein [Nitrospira sp.]